MRVCNLTVPLTNTLGENEHILAVQMHGVCKRHVIVECNADSLVPPEVVKVPFGLVEIGSITQTDQTKNRVIVVATEADRMKNHQSIIKHFQVQGSLRFIL